MKKKQITLIIANIHFYFLVYFPCFRRMAKKMSNKIILYRHKLRRTAVIVAVSKRIHIRDWDVNKIWWIHHPANMVWYKIVDPAMTATVNGNITILPLLHNHRLIYLHAEYLQRSYWYCPYVRSCSTLSCVTAVILFILAVPWHDVV